MIKQWKDLNDASEWIDIPPRATNDDIDWYEYFKNSPFQLTRIKPGEE